MNKVKEFLEKYDLTQKELAKLIRYTPAHVQRLNTGKRRVTKRIEALLESLKHTYELAGLKPGRRKKDYLDDQNLSSSD